MPFVGKPYHKNNSSSSLPPPSFPYFSDSPTISDIDSNIESDNDSYKTPPTRMTEGEKAIALEEPKYQIPPSNEKKKFSKNLNKSFPRAHEIFNEKLKEVDEIPIQSFGKIIAKLDRGETPPKLEFFARGENVNIKNKLIQLGIDQNCLDCLLL